MEYKVGQVLNWNRKGPYSFLIQLGNYIHYHKFGYDHTSIIGEVGIIPDGVSKGQQGCLVYEALDKVEKNWYECWWLDKQFDNKDLVIGTPNNDVSNIKVILDKYVGEPYDIIGIFGIVKYWLTGKQTPRTLKDDTWYCSELVAHCLNECNSSINISAELNLPEYYITPMDIILSKELIWQTAY